MKSLYVVLVIALETRTQNGASNQQNAHVK